MRLVSWTLSEHGRALGAMETIGAAMVWRGKIQEESLYYEHKKHDGSLPLVGVNTFLPKEHAGEVTTKIELIRSTPEEKATQIDHVKLFQKLRSPLVPQDKTTPVRPESFDETGCPDGRSQRKAW